MPKKESSAIWTAIIAIVGGLWAIGTLTGAGADTPDREPRNNCDRSTAYAMSQTFVERRLRAPGKAEFPWMSEAEIIELGDCRFEIQSYVDAENAFGGEVRTPYVAVVSSADNGQTWSADDIWL